MRPNRALARLWASPAPPTASWGKATETQVLDHRATTL
jgi:hypothetical protein